MDNFTKSFCVGLTIAGRLAQCLAALEIHDVDDHLDEPHDQIDEGLDDGGRDFGGADRGAEAADLRGDAGGEGAGRRGARHRQERRLARHELGHGVRRRARRSRFHLGRMAARATGANDFVDRVGVFDDRVVTGLQQAHDGRAMQRGVHDDVLDLAGGRLDRVRRDVVDQVGRLFRQDLLRDGLLVELLRAAVELAEQIQVRLEHDQPERLKLGGVRHSRRRACYRVSARAAAGPCGT
ncbi:MAG: hypothetical protein ACREMQ_19170 [Longimicrobiales bacterium]